MTDQVLPVPDDITTAWWEATCYCSVVSSANMFSTIRE